MILLTPNYWMIMWEERGHMFVYNLVVTIQIIWLQNASIDQSGSSIPKFKSIIWLLNTFQSWAVLKMCALSHHNTSKHPVTQDLSFTITRGIWRQDGGLLFHTVVALPNTVLDGISVCRHAFIDWLTRSWYYIKCFRSAFCYQFWLFYKRTLCN